LALLLFCDFLPPTKNFSFPTTLVDLFPFWSLVPILNFCRLRVLFSDFSLEGHVRQSVLLFDFISKRTFFPSNSRPPIFSDRFEFPSRLPITITTPGFVFMTFRPFETDHSRHIPVPPVG